VAEAVIELRTQLIPGYEIRQYKLSSSADIGKLRGRFVKQSLYLRFDQDSEIIAGVYHAVRDVRPVLKISLNSRLPQDIRACARVSLAHFSKNSSPEDCVGLDMCITGR